MALAPQSDLADQEAQDAREQGDAKDRTEDEVEPHEEL